jgi:hypothetical protein
MVHGLQIGGLRLVHRVIRRHRLLIALGGLIHGLIASRAHEKRRHSR